MGRFTYPETGRIFRPAPLANDPVVPQKPPCGFSRGMALQGMLMDEAKLIRSADAEQAKQTGGMVALYPRNDFAEQLVVPGGEPIEELHCTVTYYGEDVRGQDPTELIDYLHHVSSLFRPIEARIFGAGVFNSNGESPCVVYLVGGSPDLAPLQSTLKRHATERYPGAAEQHDPWVPHVTAAYNAGAKIEYEGPVIFDRIGLRWPGADQDFTL